LILDLVVTAADVSDREAAQPLIRQVVDEHDRLAKLWADQNYAGELVEWANGFENFDLEIVKRPEGATGWVHLPKRWIVERTFGWLMRHRRLVRDYERTETSAEAWIHLAMLRIQLRRLA